MRVAGMSLAENFLNAARTMSCALRYSGFSPKNDKSIFEQAALRSWMKRGGIDTLQNGANVVDLAGPQNSLVPSGAG
jgi:hypothetical protein